MLESRVTVERVYLHSVVVQSASHIGWTYSVWFAFGVVWQKVISIQELILKMFDKHPTSLGWEVVAMDTLGSLFYMCVPPYTCSIVEGVGVGGGCDGHIGQLVLHVCTTIYMLDCGRSWGGRWLRWTHWAACSTCVYHHIHARLWKELGWEVVAMDTLGSLYYMCVIPRFSVDRNTSNL